MLARFAAAGLWPGFPRRALDELRRTGFARIDDVDATALLALTGIGPVTAPRLVRALTDRTDAYDIAVLLDAAGMPLRGADRLAKELGAGAGEALRGNPWRLLAAPERSLSDADRLAAGLGLTRDHPLRGPAVVGYLLTRVAVHGHTAWPVDQLCREAAAHGVADPAAAIEQAVATGAVVTVTDTAALNRYDGAERTLANDLIRLARTAQDWSRPGGTRRRGATTALDEAQRSAVEHAMRHGVSLLTGGPGTGKSRTIAALVELAEAGGHTVALAAPTGRAAKRLEELSDAPASTLHRLLGAQGTTGLFTRCRDWPLDADLVVVDETSMLDTELAAALLQACADGTHLVLVGDPAQLPSIGAGWVLGDLVDSGAFPLAELRTLYRQEAGGTIARLATAVRSGALPPVQDPSREVVVVPSRGGADAARRTVQLVTDSIPRALGIATGDVQVVTPVHGGEAGTKALNTALKQHLNPGPGAQRGFDPGDRVVALANRPDAGFTNGEVGTVIGPGDDGGLYVAFSAGPLQVPREAVGDLTLGFAITVHRAQGSEWPAVVVVLPPEARRMLSRPLVYTAFTRAQRHLSVVPAVGAALARAVEAVDAVPRVTRLRDRLQEGSG